MDSSVCLIPIAAVNNTLTREDFAVRGSVSSVYRCRNNLRSARLRALGPPGDPISSASSSLMPTSEATVVFKGRWSELLSNIREGMILQLSRPSVSPWPVKRDGIPPDNHTARLELDDVLKTHIKDNGDTEDQSTVVFVLDQNQRLIQILSLSRRGPASCREIQRFDALYNKEPQTPSTPPPPPPPAPPPAHPPPPPQPQPQPQPQQRQQQQQQQQAQMESHVQQQRQQGVGHTLVDPHLPKIVLMQRPKPVTYNKLSDLEHAEKGTRVNVYGVIVDCRALCTTRGTDFRNELLIIDDTSLPSSPNGVLKKMIVYSFENELKQALPFRAFGDIVRIHRAFIDIFTKSASHRRTSDGGTHSVDETGIVSRQLKVGPFSNCLLWQHDSDSFQCIASREVGQCRNNHESTHFITAEDRLRIRQLRYFTRAKLLPWKLETTRSKYLINVSQAITIAKEIADQGGEKKCADLFARVDDEILDPAVTEGNLHLIVSDGTLKLPGDNQHDGVDNPGNIEDQTSLNQQKMIVRGIVSDDQRQALPTTSFVDLIPCWSHRPKVPYYVFFKDVTLVCSETNPFAVLSFGRFTSTIIIQDKLGPLFRYFKNLAEKESEENEPLNGQPINGNIHEPITLNHVDVRASSSGNVAGASHGYGGIQGDDATHNPAPKSPDAAVNHVSVSIQANTHCAVQRPQEQTPQHEESQSVLPRKRGHSTENGHPGDSSNEEATRQSSPRRQVNESQLRRLNRSGEDITIVSQVSTDMQSLSVVTLVDVKNEVRERGVTAVRRLNVRGHTCMWPVSVSHACRPICPTCKGLVRINDDGAQAQLVAVCTRCAQRFDDGLRDKALTWTYTIKLMVKDFDGSMMELWIEGDEADRFFNNLPATYLVNDVQRRVRVSRLIELILSSGNWLDCCVIAYRYLDKHCIYQVAAKLTSTKLLTDQCRDD